MTYKQTSSQNVITVICGHTSGKEHGEGAIHRIFMHWRNNLGSFVYELCYHKPAKRRWWWTKYTYLTHPAQWVTCARFTEDRDLAVRWAAHYRIEMPRNLDVPPKLSVTVKVDSEAVREQCERVELRLMQQKERILRKELEKYLPKTTVPQPSPPDGVDPDYGGLGVVPDHPDPPPPPPPRRAATGGAKPDSDWRGT